MSDILARDEHVRVVALTPDPPSLKDVALATRAGAVGFIDVNVEPDEAEEAADALREIADGGTWLPEDLARTALSQAADDLDVTADERRSRLNSILIALIPLIGIATAARSFLWRQYLSGIGVRPVDIAIERRALAWTLAALLLPTSTPPARNRTCLTSAATRTLTSSSTRATTTRRCSCRSEQLDWSSTTRSAARTGVEGRR